jgi:hypothetical protein
LTDEATLERAHAELIDWGVLERELPPRVTKRFTGALMRAFAELQAEEQRVARRPGNPVANAVDLAFEAYPVPPGAVVSPEHRRFVTAVYIASLPDAVRSSLGL